MPESQRLHACCGSAGALAGSFALAGTERKYERSRPFLPNHLALDLTLDVEGQAVSGSATLSFVRVAPSGGELRLDAVGFDIARVELAAAKRFVRVRYEYDGDKIMIAIPPRLRKGRIRVQYRARPRRGLYFLGPDEHVPDRPVQVWSQCQDEDARHFFPCHDKPHVKTTLDLIVRVPPGFVVLSNGEPRSSSTPPGRKRPWVFRFEMTDPLPSYLVTLVAGRFEVVEARAARRPDGSKVPVRYYVPPGRAGEAHRGLGQTSRIIELFGRLTGVPFPFSRYSQAVVQDFIFGGMENTTATTLYEHVLLDERAALDISSEDLVAHELAHQWFGDYVTCRDWSHAWLNEGFATFFEHLEREDRLGRDEYEHGVAADMATYLAEANGRYQRPVVCRDYEEPIDLFDRHLYQKGGVILHVLRRELGDEVFWRGVHRYLSRHAHGVVETNDLERALEEVSGRSLERFFDQWVYRAGHPVLDVKTSYQDGLVTVQVEQKQKAQESSVFAFVFQVEVRTKDGHTRRHQKWVSSRADALVIRQSERPAHVAFDPDFSVAGAVNLEAPADMLRHQLEHGSTARLRWMAAEALVKRHDPATIRALAATLSRQSETWMVRAECARVLGRIGGKQSFAALEATIKTKHPKVRRAVAAALGEFQVSEAARLLGPLARRDASYLVEAEAARALGATRQSEALETLVELIDGASWADVKRAGVLEGLSALRDEAAVPAVMERTRYGLPSRGRRAAIGALSRLGDGRRIREHLETLLDDRDPYVRLSAVRALESLADPAARGALRRALERELDGRVARRIKESLRDLGNKASSEHRRLSDELESVRREMADLKTRLAKIETGGTNRRRAVRPKGGARSPGKGASKRRNSERAP